MEFNNKLSKLYESRTISKDVAQKCIDTIARLLYPITPHISYAILSEFDKEQALNPEWPKKVDGIQDNQEIQIIVQINGKLRSKLNIKLGLNKEDILMYAKKDKKIREYIKNLKIIKEIYVQNKLVNLVTK